MEVPIARSGISVGVAENPAISTRTVSSVSRTRSVDGVGRHTNAPKEQRVDRCSNLANTGIRFLWDQGNSVVWSATWIIWKPT